VTYQSVADLRYIDGLDAIPISGPDPFSDAEKLDAAEVGETKLEADVNDGLELGEDESTVLHSEAAAAWASYKLVYGGEAPESALSGEFVEGANSDLMEFAREHKASYESHVESIIESDADESSEQADIIVSG
jgi:hypothetical protein